MRLGPALSLLRLTVDRARAFEGGRLEMRFSDGHVLNVDPDEDFEAWTFVGPDGMRIVCTPGGSLSVWSG